MTYWSGGLLLGDAVERTESPDQVETVDRHDFAAGKAAGENLGGGGIAARLTERRHEYRAVKDEKIGIGRRHAPAVAKARLRHGQLDDLEFFSGRRAQRLQPLE